MVSIVSVQCSILNKTPCKNTRLGKSCGGELCLNVDNVLHVDSFRFGALHKLVVHENHNWHTEVVSPLHLLAFKSYFTHSLWMYPRRGLNTFLPKAGPLSVAIAWVRPPSLSRTYALSQRRTPHARVGSCRSSTSLWRRSKGTVKYIVASDLRGSFTAYVRRS